MSKADPYIVDPDTGCWEWQRARNNQGYGFLAIDRRAQLAHRVYYETKHGPVPEGLELDHVCRNRGCVNPDHLEPVTHAENIQRGKLARLTAAQAREIAARLDAGESASALARAYGVTPQAVSLLDLGITWSAVTGRPKRTRT